MMSFRFFFGLLFIFVAVVFVLSGKVSKRYDLLDKKVKMHIWLPSFIGALCLAIFLYEIGILLGKKTGAFMRLSLSTKSTSCFNI